MSKREDEFASLANTDLSTAQGLLLGKPPERSKRVEATDKSKSPPPAAEDRITLIAPEIPTELSQDQGRIVSSSTIKAPLDQQPSHGDIDSGQAHLKPEQKATQQVVYNDQPERALHRSSKRSAIPTEELARLSCRLDPKVREKLDVWCFYHHSTISEALELALEALWSREKSDTFTGALSEYRHHIEIKEERDRRRRERHEGF